jgi:hypothetical protein
MTDVKVEDGHRVLTPGYQTLTMEAATGVRNPHLFAEGLGYRRLLNDDVYVSRTTTTAFLGSSI